MRVTAVQIFLDPRGDTCAYANVTFDHSICVKGFRLVRAPNDYLLYMPDVQQKDGTFRDVAEPTTDEMGRTLKSAILSEYEKVTGRR